MQELDKKVILPNKSVKTLILVTMQKRFINSALFTVVLATFFISCSKSDTTPVPDPVPTYKPDTLGTGWTKINVVSSGSDTILGDIFFNSPTNGYVVGENIYKTSDGGNTWTKVKEASINNLFVTPNGSAYFVPYSINPLYKISDGGATFSTYSMSTVPSTDIFFTDDNTGYCVGSNKISKTTDAGANWTVINTTGILSSNYSTIFCLDPNKIWVANGSGFFRSTTPGTWQQSNITGAAIATMPPSIYASSANTVYIGNGPNLFKSTDGGANYSLIRQFSEFVFTDVHFLDDQNGYVSTARTIYKTTDGGATWAKVVSLGQGYFGEIHFTDTAHGWACGYDGQGHGIVLIFRN